MNNQESLPKNKNFGDPQIHLLVLEENNYRQTLKLTEEAYSFGRDTRNAIVLTSRKVSRFHATIMRRRNPDNQWDSFWIIDGNLEGERSKNGVFVNEKRILVQSLKHEDKIIIGDVKAIYYIAQNIQEFNLIKSKDFIEHPSRGDTKKFDYSRATLIEPEDQASVLDKVKNKDLSHLASFPEISPNPIIEIDWQGRITYLNPAAIAKFRNLYQTHLQHPLLSGLTQDCQKRRGNLFVREVKIEAEVFEQYVHYLPQEQLIRSHIFNFTKRKELESSLRASKELYHNLVKHSAVGMMIIDYPSQKILECNQAYSNLLGYTIAEMLNLEFLDFLALDAQNFESEFSKIWTDKTDFQGELWQRSQDGTVLQAQVNLNFSENQGKEIVYCSLQPQKTQVDGPIPTGKKENSLYNPKTGLANHTLFTEILAKTIANLQRKKQIASLIVLQAEQWELIAKSLESEKTVTLEREIAKRLQACLRAGDTIANPEPGKFYILLPEVNQIKDSAKIAQRILNVLHPSFEVNNQTIYLNLSLGIAIYSEKIVNAQTLLNHGEIALIRSRNKGGNKYQFYQPSLTTSISRSLRLESLLQEAIAKEEFLLHYQPRIDFQTRRVNALEALIRWQHPEFGLVTPAKFLPVAEEMGLMIPLGDWVIKKACQQICTWEKLGEENLSIAVNISEKQFQHPDLANKIAAIIGQVGVDAPKIELEIAEKTVLKMVEHSRKTLAQLQEIGVKLTLDDFDPDYSSVAYLKQFPLSHLKIHQSYMTQLQEKSGDLAAIEAVLAMGKEVGLNIIVEGVENAEQLQILKNLHCQQMQGYLFSPPLTTKDAYEYLVNLRNYFPFQKK